MLKHLLYKEIRFPCGLLAWLMQRSPTAVKEDKGCGAGAEEIGQTISWLASHDVH